MAGLSLINTGASDYFGFARVLKSLAFGVGRKLDSTGMDYETADCEKTGTISGELRTKMKAESEYVRSNAIPCETARPFSHEEIVGELFKYHAPNELTIPKFAAINQAAKNFAEVVLQNCPPSRDRSTAINWIRTARMLANSAIALNGLSL